jgi:ankyrin repeat protein
VTIDHAGRTRLHYLALAGDAAGAREALSEGDDPNAADGQGFTALHLAAQECQPDVATLLLDHGAQVDAMNQFGNTPLFTAVFNSRGNGSVINLLRDRGADPHRANQSGQTPVGLARLIGNYDVAQFFDDLPSDT